MKPAPTRFFDILKHLGPGIIIAGSIVGSGELIATTLVGAKTGFVLLWLIVLGCVIKVFTLIEFGRNTIIHSTSPLVALNEIPGPKVKVRWIIWYWFFMIVLIISQQGGILGATSQAVSAISFTNNEVHWLNNINILSLIIACITALMLYFGRFAFIQSFSTFLVFLFTTVTLFNVAYLQFIPGWEISWADLKEGISVGIPESKDGLAIALAAFGLIGVGSSEIIMYPYWCLEKGYAKFTGPFQDTPEWHDNAKGWIKVLQIDAWLSLVVYTIATVAFYLLGASILHRNELLPEENNLITTLGEMYVPVFGLWAKPVFYAGAIAVLYSTFFVAAAGNARVLADSFALVGMIKKDALTHEKWSKLLSFAWPIAALVLFLFIQAPKSMIIWSGIAQAVMLPMLAFAALYFRYFKTPQKLTPHFIWQIFLIISAIGMLIVAVWTLWSKW
jgi:Mn2+/Fe2+ NRAMP family transporter